MHVSGCCAEHSIFGQWTRHLFPEPPVHPRLGCGEKCQERGGIGQFSLEFARTRWNARLAYAGDLDTGGCPAGCDWNRARVATVQPCLAVKGFSQSCRFFDRCFWDWTTRSSLGIIGWSCRPTTICCFLQVASRILRRLLKYATEIGIASLIQARGKSQVLNLSWVSLSKIKNDIACFHYKLWSDLILNLPAQGRGTYANCRGQAFTQSWA